MIFIPMEVPSCCKECWFCVPEQDKHYCVAIAARRGMPKDGNKYYLNDENLDKIDSNCTLFTINRECYEYRPNDDVIDFKIT